MVLCLLTVSLPPPNVCSALPRWDRWSACRCSAVASSRSAGEVGERTGMSRRALLMTSLVLPGATTCAQAGEAEEARFRKTPSGVKIQEVLEGTGPQANEGDLVEFNYVLRRANGYFVFSTIDLLGGWNEPVVFPLGKGKIIPGLEEVLLGMKAGGKRRALVPPDVGYTKNMSLEPQPQDFGPRRSLLSHIQEPLVFEVQLLRIK